jgi:hypothetical protein
MAENKSVYILSLDASDIYSHMYRGTSIKHDYCGMIPFSLELIKLRQEGLKVKKIKQRDKEISNDIINVKFKQNVKSGFELKRILNRKKKENEANVDYIKKLDELIQLIEKEEKHEKWREVSTNSLRKNLYKDGFKLRQVDKNTGEIKETEYVVYKRSSAKSRTGQCLFIKKSLYKKMIKWSRMGLPFKEDMEIDLASLLAYESLVGSSLEDTVEIDPNKILMVTDVDSKFNRICNVVRKGNEGFLDSFTEDVTVSNSLFDGESLLESKYFEDGIAMKLLRNHMFKSAAFNCNIQKFLKDNCPTGVDYNEWKLKDMFGNQLFAKDIDLICTPSSLKALKFSNVIGTDKDMWDYWKQKVSDDGNLFGVCKHDKQSKFGEDENGDILQQTSYQMINCLPMTSSDVKELTKTEIKYIERLKNDDEFFIDKVRDTAAMVNGNEMLSELYKHNKKFINTKTFRSFRKDFIWHNVSYSKRGKIKLHGDYCVMLGNPMEFLNHAIGVFHLNKNNLSLKDNEIYTTLFEFDKEYIGFRNPNTSPSNVLLVKNKQVKEIEDYFNLTDNIVCVNAVHFPIQDILSGCDYDSDTVLLFNDPKMLELGKRCFGEYYVCINDVEGQKKKYKLNKHDMYEIDNQLSTSQRNIGKVVNLGQFCMSVYWDLLNNGESGEHVDELLKKVDVMTVLSGIAIDMAKKFYEIDINKEIENVSKNVVLKERKRKPQFWKYVSQSKTIKNRIVHYDCPMDYLIDELELIEQAERKGNINFDKLLVKKNEKKANRKQMDKILSKVTEADNFIKKEIIECGENDEKLIRIEDVLKECTEYIKKLKIKEDTMYVILKNITETNSKIMMRLLKALYESHKDVFLNAFKKGKNQ